MLRDHPDVVDEVGEEGRDDPPVAVVVVAAWRDGRVRSGARRTTPRIDRRTAPRPLRSRRTYRIAPSGRPLLRAPRRGSLARDGVGSARQETVSTGAIGGLGRAHAHPRGDGAGDRGQRPRGRSRFALRDRGHADVAALADGHVERHAAEVVDAVLRGEALAAAAPEDLGQLAAVRAGERGHVLDETEDRHAHPLEHRERLGHVRERDLLGRRDQHGAARSAPPGPASAGRRTCPAAGR